MDTIGCLDDVELPAFSTLTRAADEVLAVAVEASGAEFVSATARQTNWNPGTSLNIRYDVELRRNSTHQTEMFVASTDVIDNALQLQSNGTAVSLWRLPFDPRLPGLELAMDGRGILGSVGVNAQEVRTQLVSYRPGRRAVVMIDGYDNAGTWLCRVFVKVMRPRKVKALHDVHEQLVGMLPVPKSLGYSIDHGLLVLQALPGQLLRTALGTQHQPTGMQLIEALDRIDLEGLDSQSSSNWRVDEFTGFLKRICPEANEQLTELREELLQAESSYRVAPVAVHGDFHEAQVLVHEGEITGLIDLDTVRMGQRVDDLANMIGHLSTLAISVPQTAVINKCASDWLSVFDAQHDPRALRMASSSVVLGLATSPFRVLENNWRINTLARIQLAYDWMLSARQLSHSTFSAATVQGPGQGEKHLIKA